MFDADRPIIRSDQDRLNRSLFAKYLARCLLDHKDPESLVVGLYGGWGVGKTSVINLMIEELNFAASNMLDEEEGVRIFSPKERDVFSLKELCVNFLAKNFNYVWANKNIIKLILSGQNADIEKEKKLFIRAKDILSAITQIETSRKMIRENKINQCKKDLMNNSCFVKSVSSTASILETLSYLGVGYGIARGAEASATVIISIFGLSPAVFCVSAILSTFIVTPIIAKEIATYWVDNQEDPNRELARQEIEMLPPHIKVMRP